MKSLFVLPLVLAACAAPQKKAAPVPPSPIAVEDPGLWLEDVTGEKALGWVREQNKKSTSELTTNALFEPLRKRLLDAYDSTDKIPYANREGKYLYNFWRDAAHPSGIWRRTSLAEYQKPKPAWETVIDVDALAKKENQTWVWKGADCLRPRYERCLVSLSRGGADASIVREFDAKKKAFVDDGFSLPESKGFLTWRDENEVFVSTDFGPDSLTDSGYPRIVKLWKRGTPMTAAKTLYSARKDDVGVGAGRSWDHDKPHDIVQRQITAFDSASFLYEADALVEIPVPHDTDVHIWDDLLIVTLRSDWSGFEKGASIAAPLAKFFTAKEKVDGVLRGVAKVAPSDFTVIFDPSVNRSLAGMTMLKSAILVTELEDVHDRVYVWTRKAGKLVRSPLVAPLALGSISVFGLDDTDSDEYFLDASDFTMPSTLYYSSKLGGQAKQVKQEPSFFDAKNLVVEQHFVKSKDGTRVPYFQVSRKGLALDGQNPTLLTGYGGFEISLGPEYSATEGMGWLERGGVYVQANIRGGGEYGPSWHDSAIKANRQRAYDDFIAIAEDLVARKVTSPARLGIQGGSNGGLLMGVMLTERPDLFGAIVCEAPLLDMKRYHKLLAGASWMAEYGNPDVPEEWATLAKYSPYQNLKHGVHYPRTLFTTSTRDDRVHPGHARKMAARMLGDGDDILFYENIEGGHAGAANHEEQAYLSALAFTFLSQQLKLAR